ncbi:MAG TPA: sensor histidine kinase [Micromonosporaceae bacterium]|nr:sensor histidine kinase [Micromonosporaceae bacterium]HCU49456.1 sensor histidine kinase [Micromonosporaceae bacterium]
MLATLRRMRELPPLVLDTGIAVVCYLAMALLLADMNSPWWTFLLAFLATAPLIWRRRWPIGVALVAGIGTTALGVGGYLHDQPYGQLVATYTFASLSPLVWRIVGGFVTALGVGLSLMFEEAKVFAFGYVLTAYVAAYALGMAARSRRERIALLEERELRHAEEKEAAAARERERIARDMHDIIAHSIGVIVVQAESGPVALRTDPARAEAIFGTISDAGRNALTQLRSTLGVLRGATDRHPQPDLDALPQLIETSPVPAKLTEEGERPSLVPAQVSLAAYRVVQESLTNTNKHARASNVDVKLAWLSDALALEVRDDGIGRAINTGGHGLIGMRERVTACGGELSSGPAERGWLVSARLPL